MANPTPISPPTAPPTADIPSASDTISPVSQASTFMHKTSPATATQTRVIDTSTPAINAHPVELDGMPTSPEELKRRETGGSTGVGSSISPADGEDIDAEFLGEGGKGAGQIGREVCYSSKLSMPTSLISRTETCRHFGFTFQRPWCDCRCATRAYSRGSGGCEEWRWDDYARIGRTKIPGTR
jgi:hypothetical protein